MHGLAKPGGLEAPGGPRFDACTHMPLTRLQVPLGVRKIPKIKNVVRAGLSSAPYYGVE